MTVYDFVGYRLDTDRVEISGPEGVVQVEPQVFEVLAHLLANHDRMVAKEELLDAVWGGRFVSESALTTRIKQARRVLGDDGNTQALIRTVHGRGYRFVASVEVREAGPSSLEGDGGERDPEAAGSPADLPAGLDTIAAPAFVGRESELDELSTVWHRPSTAGAAWVALLGEAGIGKTRLAAETARRAAASGASVLYGRCSEDLGVPYQPLIEAVRSTITGTSPSDIRATLGPSADELARLLPELADASESPRAPGGDPETERYLLFEAVADWWDRWTRDRPVVVVVDDTHWATDSTVQLLEHLARSPRLGRATFVLTVRDTDPYTSTRLPDFLDDLAAKPGNRVLRLSGLDPRASRELLSRPPLGEGPATGPGPAPDLDAMVAQAAGNPLFLQALGGGSAGVDAAVRRRVGRLGPRVRDTLVVASVIGLEFDLKVLARVVARDELDVIADLDGAVVARLLDDVGGDLYRFTHALVRSSLRDALGSARRARWHARIGAAIEHLEGDRSAASTSVAYHYAEASAADPSLRRVAVEHLRTAAARAADQLSYVEVVDLLARATTLVDHDDHELRGLLARERGDAEKRLGRNVPALHSFDLAIEQARAAGRHHDLVEAALRYEDVSWRPGRRGGPAIERLTEALLHTGPGDPTSRARVLVALTRAYSMEGRVAESERCFAELEPLVAQLGDPLLETRALSARLASYDDHRPSPPLDRIERLRELCDQVEDVEAELLARQIHLRNMVRFGRMRDYRTGLGEMERVVSTLHSSFWSYVLANHHAMLALHDGDLAAAEEAALRCAEVGEGLVQEDTSGTLGLRMFVIRREQDRLAGLAPVVRQLLGTDGPQALWAPGLALLLAEIGHEDDAASMLREFHDGEFDVPPDAMWSTVMTMFVELAVVLGAVEPARDLYRRLAGQSGYTVVTGAVILSLGSADRYLGELALTFGDLVRAGEHLEHGIEADEANGAPLWAGHGRLALSEVRRREGRTAEADRLRTTVSKLAERAGYAALARHAASR